MKKGERLTIELENYRPDVDGCPYLKLYISLDAKIFMEDARNKGTSPELVIQHAVMGLIDTYLREEGECEMENKCYKELERLNNLKD